jgi:hypothetical protein
MGTSVSQPSPSGNGEVGKAWQAARDATDTASPSGTVENVLAAYSAEYGNSTIAVLCDAGVRTVESMLAATTDQLSSDAASIAKFSIEVRRALAAAACNSFLAEVAIGAATKSLEYPTADRSIQFVVEYTSRIVEYTVSRDLPFTIATEKLVNLRSAEALTDGIRKYIQTTTKGIDQLNVESLLLKLKGGHV